MERRSYFWGAVGAEARATWGGFRWFWACVGLGLLLWMALTTEMDWFGKQAPPFVALCALACWLPAWLCSDLLSLRFPHNPEPHREWRPVEFLARGVGRLGSFYLALALMAGTYCGRSLFHDLNGGGGPAMFGPPEIERADELPGWWAAWVLVFLFSSLPYAAAASLASACFRRPRRRLVTPVVVLLLSLTLIAAFARQPTDVLSLFTESDSAVWMLLMPNFTVGYVVVLNVQQHSPELLEGLSGSVGAFPAICILASGFFLLCALPMILLTWRIAARRFRRHPYTVLPGEEGPLELALRP